MITIFINYNDVDFYYKNILSSGYLTNLLKKHENNKFTLKSVQFI